HGGIRECHGDLHLGNMVLIDGCVRLFDCIEFNPELRWIDVMSEVAFVMMDLLRYQRRDLAYRFLNRYLEITGDYDGAAVLPYYVVYRALVRAKVAAMRAGQPGVTPQLQRSLHEKTNSHVSIAQQMASNRRPMLAILHGLSGSGKTVVSQAVLETIGAIRIRSDIERKRLHGLSPAARTGAQPGGGIYSMQAGAATYDRLTELTSQILDAGFPVLVDAAFLTRERREQMRNLAQAKKMPFAILHTHASEATLRQRIAQRAVDAGDASEADSDVLDWQLANQEPLTNAELRETFTFDTERRDPCAVARQVADLFS
ncbi:MAG: AAA family ATPase, partial [Betaproteobacteria bacterium]